MSITTFTRFAGFIGIVIIFVSWVISNTLVTAAEEDTQAMDSVQTEQAQVEQFSNLSSMQRSGIKRMALMEINLTDRLSKIKPSDNKQEEVKDQLDSGSMWLAAVATDIADLEERTNQLDELVTGLGQRVSLAETTKSKVDATIKRAKELKETFDVETATYEQMKNDHLLPSAPSQNETGDVSDAIEAHFDSIDKILEGYEAINDEVLSQYEAISKRVSDEHQRSTGLAKTGSTIAFFFYGLGTAIVGIGKWLENRTNAA
jgi:chromosome segregation ATPase